MASINIEIKGLDAVKKTIEDKIAKCKNLTPIMREVSEIMLDSVQDNFEYQRDGETEQDWRDLAEITKKKREKIGKWPGRILRVKTLLYKSIQPRATATEAIVGTNMAYAAIHQFGGTINIPVHTNILHFKKYKSGKHKGKTLFAKNNTKASYGMKSAIGAYQIKMPARPFLKITDNDLINTITRRFIDFYMLNK